MLSFACVIRLLPSYESSIHRPLGEVIFVMFPPCPFVRVSRILLPLRSRISCKGAFSPKTNTVPSLRTRSQPLPFHEIFDLKNADGVAVCSKTASAKDPPGEIRT